MNLQIVGELIKMMENSSLTGMEVEQGGLRVRLENGQNTMMPAAPRVLPSDETLPSSAPSQETPAPAATPEPESVQSDDASTPVGSHEIVSPMVGTYHELKDKIKAGSKLKKGDPVCVIEAMKVMNEILMEEDGEITWVAANEGDMVEYGQMLFMFD